ncbi:MAG: dihydroorotate oxidase [Candidatus Pacearchaeota archaeon]|nr:dihydroorotate oxidase [Candidatus Pacearchaeota archaeon]
MKTKVANAELNSYVCNASGIKDVAYEELKAIAESNSAAIVMKSCTPEPRSGNEEPRYMRLPFGAIQSMGLPNLGYKEYIRIAAELKKYRKPIIASVAGLSPDDFPKIVRAFQSSDVNLIEVNLSCPNLEGKPQIAYDFNAADELLGSISNLGYKPIGIKLPPYYDLAHFKKIADIIKSHNISFITCINSVGNTLAIDPENETPLIKPKSGLGGLSGGYIKNIALANVKIFRELLGNRISIFGVGGINSGTDAFEFLLAGADAVQIGTVFEKEGIHCFRRINEEFESIMKRKGYGSVLEARGNLKYL